VARVIEEAVITPHAGERDGVADLCRSGLADLRAQRGLLVSRLRGFERVTRPAVAALEELSQLDAELHLAEDSEQRRRIETLAEIHQAMRRLRDAANPAELIEIAPRELCCACGFTRAMISRVHGSRWIPEVLHIDDGVDREGADAFKAYVAEAEIPLAHMLVEAELVRRRIPALVTEPLSDPRTFKEIVEVSRSSSFVVAPIMQTRRVIGFFHADRFGGAAVDEIDRDNLWTFTEHFGLLFERAVLVGRLERQRSELRSSLADAAAQIDEIVTTDIELARNEEPETRRDAPVSQASRLDLLLTAREREVLELMVSGATNTNIANQLVVSEGTVKSHVKRILRKLHVSNRAEAAARYLHLVQGPEDTAR
jgi:DNA-binding CsgD family transcriptional regulator